MHAINAGDRRMAKPRFLVVGVGNELLSDDGVGIHLLRELQREPNPDVALIEVGTAILHGIEFLEGVERVLIVDAAKGGNPPGTLYRFEAEAPPSGQPFSSIHAMGLREAAHMLLPPPLPSMTVLGIEPATLEYGMSLSAPVTAALPSAVALARKTLAEWRAAETREPAIL